MGDVKAQAAAVGGDAKGNGVALFTAMFAAKPEWRDLFPKMKGGTNIDADHAEKVIKMVISCVNGGAGACEQVGKDHITRGVTTKDFEALAPILLSVLKEKLGGAYNEGAWVEWYTKTFLPNLGKGLGK